MAAIIAILLVLVASIAVGTRGIRTLRGTDDFLVAARSIKPRGNAIAVAGEYLSAASFLGIAGLVMKIGIGGMWYPVGFTAGYVTLLVLVAAPLRRFGGYTVPDFVEGRLGSLRLRRLVALVGFAISGLYVVPQLKGAGLILHDVASVPYPLGVALTAGVIAAVVAAGGMRSATYLQAFEYGVKIACVAVPAVILLIALSPHDRADVLRPDGTRFVSQTTVHLPAHTGLAVTEATPVVIGHHARTLPIGSTDFGSGTTVTFLAGTEVPRVVGQSELGGAQWQQPLIRLPGVGHPLYVTWAIVLTLTLGTAGLPHVLARFGTNPTGSDARRTAVVTVGLVGFFYLFPSLYGLIGRSLAPKLYLSSNTDSVVAVLPSVALHSGGGLLTAMTSAGAFAAFLSTSTGLLLTAGSAISRDVRSRQARRSKPLQVLRWGILGATLAAVLVSLAARSVDISVCVSWAFDLAASTVTPLLVLGIWGDRLTARGAAAGVAVGGGLASVAVLASLVGHRGAGWVGALVAAPGPISAAGAVLVMLTVSALSRHHRGDAGAGALALARMHRADPRDLLIGQVEGPG